MLSLILVMLMLTFDDDVMIAGSRCLDVPSAVDDHEFTFTLSVTVNLPGGERRNREIATGFTD